MRNDQMQLKMVTIHFQTSIYQGLITQSYSLEGFGIWQSSAFETYVGYFKKNVPHGLGLLILPSGHKIYGKWENGELDGISIADDGRIIQCGIIKDMKIIGVGFQYHMEYGLWKMSKYHKGVPIQVIKEEKVSDNTMPQLLNIEPKIMMHYLNYKNRQFFPSKGNLFQFHCNTIQSNYIHCEGSTEHYGLYEPDKPQGLGIKLNAGRVIEGGYYSEGLLNGYGFKKDQLEGGILQIGLFIMGKKHGLFIERNKEKIAFYEYNKGLLTGTADQKKASINFLKKQQKLHNYRQKTFKSEIIKLNFTNIYPIFDTHDMKARKQQQGSNKLRDLAIANNFDIYYQLDIVPKSKKDKSHQKKRKNQSQTPKNGQNGTNIILIGTEKSAVQIIKDKILNIEKKPMSKYLNKVINLNHMFIEEKKQKSIAAMDQDEIAIEQSPFVKNIPNSKLYIKKRNSFNRML